MKIFELTVLPDTPPELQKLQKIAFNLYFSWNDEAMDLYKKMDAKLWEECERSPIRFLSEVSSDILHTFAKDKQFIQELDKVYEEFDNYMNAKTWFSENHEKVEKENMAYFSCEFGLHESVPIYSGGLGVLSGDHIKSASDLGLPLVGVGLLYRSGYFKQFIDQGGNQIEQFSPRNLYNLPITPILNDDGTMRYFSLDLPDGPLWFNVFILKVGRISIYLLNSYVPQNDAKMQAITDRLYDSDREKRIMQEYLLGIGGFKVLQDLGHTIEMYHLNEGHSAFLIFEYLRYLTIDKKLSYEEAKHFVQESTCFTTHTPVPAGNERFTLELIEKYFSSVAKSLEMNWDYFLSLGRENPSDPNEEFCLTILALKLCNRNNGVAKLHGVVSRQMWKNLYTDIPVHEVPIGSITNGVHGETWTDSELKEMLHEKYKGKNPFKHFDSEFYRGIYEVSDEDLWDWKIRAKATLIEYTRKHLIQQYVRCHAGQKIVEQAKYVLNENALTIGFARRFATYKRGNLFLRDKGRLLKILQNTERPVQFLFAGKAHPADQYGKDIIKSIYASARELGVEDKLIFLENYNMTIAKYLVTGVDVWLNNPIKPQEASGTSGMKAGMNGALNLSISDGWWDEAYNASIGWSIETPVKFTSPEEQDSIDADILYNLLESEVIPTYYDNADNKYSHKWIAMMKNSIASVGGNFNSIRMLHEYTQRYNDTVQSCRQLKNNDFAMLRQFSQWKIQLFKEWPTLNIVSISEPVNSKVKREDNITIEAKIELGKIKPEDVNIQCYHGELIGEGEIDNPVITEMKLDTISQGIALYKTSITPSKGGKLGYTVRAIPNHKNISNPLGFGLIYWYQ